MPPGHAPVGYIPKYGVSVEGSAIANKTLVCSTFQTPLGDTLSPSAKQPLEPYIRWNWDHIYLFLS